MSGLKQKMISPQDIPWDILYLFVVVAVPRSVRVVKFVSLDRMFALV